MQQPAEHPRVLLVEDDRRLAEMLVPYLERHGFAVRHVLDGETALPLMRQDPFDLLVLDIMLPGMDGMEVCRHVREKSQVPIIMLTARGEETDRVVGLELGADDYVPKPFSSRELVARMRAVLRRSSPAEPTDNGAPVLRYSNLVIDPGTRTVSCNGVPCELTAYQFDLLYYLASRPGRVLSRETILAGVRGEQLEPFDRSIDVHISRIRQAIEPEPKKPRLLLTVRGVGYQFAAVGDEDNT